MPEPSPNDADMLKAFQELAKFAHTFIGESAFPLTFLPFCNRGERTAAAMEKQLTALEHKIDDLLASVDTCPDGKDSNSGDRGQKSTE